MKHISQMPDDPSRILIVDDEQFIRDILADFLGMEGYVVRTAANGSEALENLKDTYFDLVIADLKMPEVGGLELLDKMPEVSPGTLTIIMTGYGTVETAIRAMKQGAYDYVLKPFKMEEVIKIVQRGLEKQRLSAENLRLREALALYRASEAISSSLSLEGVLEALSEMAVSEVHADVATVWLSEGLEGFKEAHRSVASRVIEGEQIGELDPEIIAQVLSNEQSVLVRGDKLHVFFKTKPAQHIETLMIVPLRTKQRMLGWVALYSFNPNYRFNEGHRKLVAIVAARAAAAAENARLYEDLQATFQQTIQGLAQAIDKMDAYTAGHSDRVARYASEIARSLGLPDDVVETVRQSALMHDIGKVGCLLNLNKPGKLTQQEYEIFKKHPEYGRDIIEPIKFLHPLIPGVHLHHERWDGKGYPLHLVGNEIPLMARIIAVADAYDAMTSDRAYRRKLPTEVAIAEIKRCAGTQFDPEVANALVEIIERAEKKKTSHE